MPNLLKHPIHYLLLAILVLASACNKNEVPDTSKFSIEDTINLGENIGTALAGNENIELLDPKRYPEIFQFVDITLAEILQTNEITYTEEYAWDVNIIHDDSSANAFIFPGGNMYITTGLLRNHIATKSELFSVIAHEMVYADNGFVMTALQNEYSPSSLLDISLGNNQDAAGDLSEYLMTTPYNNESIQDADKKTCRIICASDYLAESFSVFLNNLFQQTTNIGWTTLHPDNGFRITNVNSTLEQLSCTGTDEQKSEYESFISKLP